jgi:hypothetical protein
MDQIQEILGQELSRKQFLHYAGALVLTVLGVNALIGNLQKITRHKTAPVASGYGSTSYGGRNS